MILGECTLNVWQAQLSHFPTTLVELVRAVSLVPGKPKASFSKLTFYQHQKKPAFVQYIQWRVNIYISKATN